MSIKGKYIQITFEEREEVDSRFADFLEEYFEVVACNYTDDGLEQYVVYENTKFDEKAFTDFARSVNVKLLPYKVEVLENKNWLKDNVIKFDPVELDDFLIYGVHEKTEPKTDKIPVKIYAATAFGSEHQTTMGCLLAISELNKTGAKRNKVLDMGCGSGILSIAAAKIWKNSAEVFAVDIDEEAIEVTRQNAADNNVDDAVFSEASNGYSSDFVKNNGPYDIIISNILARPLIDMAKDLNKNLKKGGYCILSGFVADQTDWVIDAHKEQGLKPVDVYEIDNWRAVLMEKK